MFGLALFTGLIAAGALIAVVRKRQSSESSKHWDAGSRASVASGLDADSRILTGRHAKPKILFVPAVHWPESTQSDSRGSAMQARLLQLGVKPEVVGLVLIGAALLGIAVLLRKRMKFR